jgi:hypothetical protein
LDSGFRAQGLGSRVQALEFRNQDKEIKVKGLRSRFKNFLFSFGIHGLGITVGALRF